MWKEHIALHLHVKNSVQLHQTEAWMIIIIVFLLTSLQRKRKRAFFQESLLEGATHFMRKKMIKTSYSSSASFGDKNRKPCGPTRDQNVRKEQWMEL